MINQPIDGYDPAYVIRWFYYKFAITLSASLTGSVYAATSGSVWPI